MTDAYVSCHKLPASVVSCYYRRSNKIYFRGLGLIARLEDLDYDDGEPQ